MDQQYTVEDWLDDMAQISGVHVWCPIRKCWVWDEDDVPVGSPSSLVENEKGGR